MRRHLIVLCGVVWLLAACVYPPTWTNNAIKSYPKADSTIVRVEQWRPYVVEALQHEGLPLDKHLDRALVVMACESEGQADHKGGGLYQFTTRTWASTRQAGFPRSEPVPNIYAMAELVARSGWSAWAGGRLSDGSLWGSGPKGHRCWR